MLYDTALLFLPFAFAISTLFSSSAAAAAVVAAVVAEPLCCDCAGSLLAVAGAAQLCDFALPTKAFLFLDDYLPASVPTCLPVWLPTLLRLVFVAEQFRVKQKNEGNLNKTTKHHHFTFYFAFKAKNKKLISFIIIFSFWRSRAAAENTPRKNGNSRKNSQWWVPNRIKHFAARNCWKWGKKKSKKTHNLTLFLVWFSLVFF